MRPIGDSESCDPHPVIWGRCPVCSTVIAMTHQMPQGACFSGGAAYAHHMPRSAYTGQPDEGGACMRCGEDVEAGEDEPTQPGGQFWTEDPILSGARFLREARAYLDERLNKPAPEASDGMRTLQVGGETWLVRS